MIIVGAMATDEHIRSLLSGHIGFLGLTRRNDGGLAGPSAATLKDGTRLTLIDSGILQIEPRRAGEKDIVISSGVHGNETAPIEIVDSLARDIADGSLTVANRLLLIIGNPVAMNNGRRFEVENLNRLFNGKHKGLTHYEAQRAGVLERAVGGFFGGADEGRERLHYDLHTAIRGSKYRKFVLYPCPDGRDWDKEQLRFFLASDIDTVLLSNQPSSTFSYFSRHRFGAHGFTVELGQVRPFGENDMSEFAAISGNLRKLIGGRELDLKPFSNDDFNLFRIKAELTKRSDEFKLNFARDGVNFTEFVKGFQLTEDIDGGYIIEQSGEAIVFPNADVPIGQRAGLIVQKTRI